LLDRVEKDGGWMTDESSQVLACNPGAMTSEQRRRYAELSKTLRESVREVQELPNGYEFEYAPDPAVLLAVAEFVSLESRCCPFYRFVLEKEPGDGPLRLRVTGPAGAKEFIRPVLGTE
jgi:hypothetical protein